MRLKILILTILVGFLAAVSFYAVYGEEKPRTANNLALIGTVESKEKVDSQTAYLLPISEPNHLPVRDSSVPDPVVAAKAYLLYEVKNGKTVLAKNAQQTLPIASLTKLLTAVIALENLDLQETLTITQESHKADGETADFYLGEKLSFENLLGAMLIKSSNDAAAAIARQAEAKTGVRFGELMNQKAYEIGMLNSSFLDAAGLNDEAYSSAEDLLKLVNYSKKYSQIWKLLGMKEWVTHSVDGKLTHTFPSTNKLFQALPEIVGGKTGYTDAALGCMILEVKINPAGQESSFIAIVLGSSNRFEDTKKLIEWGKTAFRWE